MIAPDLQALMQRVLDGECTPEETARLHERLAADPAARAEFAALTALFQRLASVEQPHPPKGLVAAVDAALPRAPQGHQLSAGSGVFRSRGDDIRIAATPHPPQNPTSRSVPMSQSSSPFSNRKTWVGAGVATLVVVVVAQFGFDGQPKKEDLTGTIVPAERYRAAQGGAADIQLGDQSVAQLMQNDAFVRMVKDPQVRAMATDPGFQAAARLMLASPEAAQVLLANAEAARSMAASTEAARALLANAEAARTLQASAEAARVLMANAEAAKMMQAHPQLAKFVSLNAEAAKVLMSNTEAAKVMAANTEAARVMSASAEAAKAMLAQAEIARFMQANPDAARFLSAHAEAAKAAAAMPQAAQALAANSEAAKFFAANSEAARVLMAHPEAARMLANSPDAARFVLSNSEAARIMLANPAASRALMQGNQASLQAVFQSVEASRIRN